MLFKTNAFAHVPRKSCQSFVRPNPCSPLSHPNLWKLGKKVSSSGSGDEFRLGDLHGNPKANGNTVAAFADLGRKTEAGRHTSCAGGAGVRFVQGWRALSTPHTGL
jgi:hypothetical protein